MGTKGHVVDKFGDAVLCCTEIPGDGLRSRHDLVKQAIYKEACLSKIPTDLEVYGLFGDLLPASLTEDGGELQWGRARQGKVPDFKFLLPSPNGPEPSLAELKVIGAARTWYPRGANGRGTERRACKLNNEYEAKLADLDRRFHNGADGEQQPRPGPLVSRFRDMGGLHRGGLVAGPWGDISADLAKLIQIFAESRAENLSRAQGWEAGDLVGKLTGEIRRSLCVSIVRASQLCLLERLSQLGPGAPAAAARRQKTLNSSAKRKRGFPSSLAFETSISGRARLHLTARTTPEPLPSNHPHN